MYNWKGTKEGNLMKQRYGVWGFLSTEKERECDVDKESFFFFSHNTGTRGHSLKMINERCCLVIKSCPIHCTPMDCSTPGHSIH